jgi:hypothetical protein
MLNHLPRTNSSATNDLSGDESFDDATPPPPMDFHFSYSPVKQPATSSPSSNHPSSIPLHLEKERDPTPGLDLNGSPSSVSSSSSATTPPSSLSAGTSRSSAFSLYPKSRQPLGPTQSLGHPALASSGTTSSAAGSNAASLLGRERAFGRTVSAPYSSMGGRERRELSASNDEGGTNSESDSPKARDFERREVSQSILNLNSVANEHHLTSAASCE